MNRIAVISDVHGNRWALKAVLEDIDQQGIFDIVNLGDTVYGPLDPAGTADILIRRGMVTVRGNEDRLVLDDNEQARNDTLRHVRRCLAERHISWLGTLKAKCVHQGAFLCHGTPEADTRYLLWEIGPSGAVLRRPAEVAAELGTVAQRLVLCGHDHVPQSMKLPTGTMVVDPGSVGLPAYCDDEPYSHVMAAGAPHARYAIVTDRGWRGWWVQRVQVSYDWQAAASLAMQNGRSDWAEWLSTGRASIA